jgi:dTDP-4-amino-4,6-dideoxygalactose transaminase
MPDHLFGIPSDMDRIMDLCKKRGVFVVEDAAQAMGGDHKGRRLGMIGDVGFFSLDRGKNITCGSGGIIVTNSDYIADEIEREYSRLGGPGIVRSIAELIKFVLISILIRPSLYWFPSRLTFLKLGETTFYKDFSIKKLSGMHAGTLRGWQKRLEESNRIRKENASFFIKKLGLQTENGGSIFFLRLPFMVKNREMKESIYILSNEGGLGISRMYPAPINEIREIRNQFEGKMFPFAQETADCLLTLPTHQLLSSEDKEKICSCLMRSGL